MAERPEILTLPCATAPDDQLTMERIVTSGVLVVTIQVSNPRNDADLPKFLTHHLDARTARELFNWLGVELHKGGLSDG